MLKFILYDDQEVTFKKTSNIINRFMMNYDIEYRIEKFSKYDLELDNLIKNDNSEKIYLLDVEVPNVNGISLATKIRKHDWNSIILFLTSYNHYRNTAFSERLMVLDYICKKDDYQTILKDCLKTALTALDKNRNMLIYKFNSLTYRILLDEILYVVKVPLNKKCMIHTINGEKFEIAGNIQQVEKKLGRSFKQCHKSCIANVKNVRIVDSANCIITFKNGKSTDMLSVRMRKGFEDYVLNYKD